MGHVYSGDVFERAVAKDCLEKRLEINRKYQSTDFDAWLLARLNARPGEHVLDVGCGTGAQSLPLLQRVGDSGSICALDISVESVQALVEKAAGAKNLTAVVADMANLDEVIARSFPRRRFDLAQSSYALYYSPERLHVLDVMRAHLEPRGRMAVFTPNQPHGMVELARLVGPIPAGVDDSLRFGPTELEPFFRRYFWDVSVHFFHNLVRVSSVDDVMTFYRSTTYFQPECEAAFHSLVNSEVVARGALEYEKNGYLIIGRDPIA